MGEPMLKPRVSKVVRGRGMIGRLELDDLKVRVEAQSVKSE